MSNYKNSVFFMSTLLLMSCGSNDMDQLQNYVKITLAKEGKPVEALPPIKPYERYLYQSEKAGLRDPFDPFFFGGQQLDSSNLLLDSKQDRYTNEILTHKREELEYFELDSLRMVGSVRDRTLIWGIVKDQEGIVYRVKVGNYLGRNYGKIQLIEENRITLREIIKDTTGRWSERVANIALSDEGS